MRLRLLLLFIAIGAWWLLPEWDGGPPLAFAQIAGSDEAMRQNSVWLIYFLIQVLNVLAWLCFALLQFLLDPQIIFDLNSPTGSLVAMLNNIWQLSRDLVNLFFALALVGISIYTVVTANKTMIQQHAAKFALAVVLVNFSWFLPRIVIDVANVTASTIYGIPSLMTGGPGNPTGVCKTLNSCPAMGPPSPGCQFSGIAGQCLCTCRRVVDIAFFPIIDNTLPPRPNSTAAWEGMGYNCHLRLVCYREEDLDMNTIAGHSAILNGLIVNYARLGALVKPPPPAAGRDALVSVLVRGGIILFIQTALTFPLLAMVVSFLIRIPILWLTISFMPFYFLGWFLDDRITQGVPKKVLELFLKAAFMPAVVAAPLAIGFILINAALAQDFTGAGAAVGGLLNITAPIIDGVSNLWQLLWLLMSVMVIYTGVFKAIQGVQLGEEHGRMIQRIQDTGRQVRQMAVQGAMMVPIPGTTGAGPGGRGITGNDIRLQLRALNPITRLGAGVPPAPLTGNLQAQANLASANAAANSAAGERLRRAVAASRTGGENERREVRQALHQLNPTLNAMSLTNEQLVQVLQHMQNGPSNPNRIRNLGLTPEAIRGLRGQPPTPRSR